MHDARHGPRASVPATRRAEDCTRPWDVSGIEPDSGRLKGGCIALADVPIVHQRPVSRGHELAFHSSVLQNDEGRSRLSEAAFHLRVLRGMGKSRFYESTSGFWAHVARSSWTEPRPNAGRRMEIIRVEVPTIEPDVS